jgi:hypothetical protein
MRNTSPLVEKTAISIIINKNCIGGLPGAGFLFRFAETKTVNYDNKTPVEVWFDILQNMSN